MNIQLNTKHRYKIPTVSRRSRTLIGLSTALLNENNKHANACENNAIRKENKYVSKNV